MTKIIINGVETPIVCDIYTIRQLGLAINEPSVHSLFERYRKLSTGKNAASFEFMDLNANLVFEMIKRGVAKSGEELKVKLSDCYEVMTNPESEKKIVEAMFNFLPAQEVTAAKKKIAKAAKLMTPAG